MLRRSGGGGGGVSSGNGSGGNSDAAVGDADAAAYEIEAEREDEDADIITDLDAPFYEHPSVTAGSPTSLDDFLLIEEKVSPYVVTVLPASTRRFLFNSRTLQELFSSSHSVGRCRIIC